MGIAIFYAAQFLVETVILFLALWIMLKLQDLDFNYPGLIGTAALGVATNIGLHHLIGIYGSTGLVTVVLYLCVWKLTGADFIDVKFTVFIGTALVFLINICLLTFLTSDLRPDFRHQRYAQNTNSILNADDDAPTVVAVSNPPARPAAVQTDGVVTNAVKMKPAPTPAPPTPVAATPLPSKPAPAAAPSAPPAVARATGKYVKDLTLRGLTRNSAAIHTSKKTYSIGLGETVPMDTAEGLVNVRCDSIGGDSVALDLEGEKVTLLLP